jgi:orotate phosphoribosyltransferase-like protein
MVLVKDLMKNQRVFVIALLVGVIASGLPYGFVISLVVGTILYYTPSKLSTLKNIGNNQTDKNEI